ncbi:MAG: site-specific integrase [Candidatus Krumholzibacteriia bacterium]
MKAGEHAKVIANGGDPREAGRALRAELTLGQAAELYMTEWVVPRKAPKTAVVYRSLINSHLGPWKMKKLSTLTKNKIQRLHTEIGLGSGPYAANRVHSFIRAVYFYAIDNGYYTGSNPAVGVIRHKESSRDRIAQRDELARLGAAWADEPHTTARDCMLVALLTGARISNVMAMAWEDLHLEGEVPFWRIPRTKSGEAVVIYLSNPAVAVLKARHGLPDRSDDWVFPSHGKTGHLVELKTVWTRVLKRAGIPDEGPDKLRLHDMRRTLGSYAVMEGFASPIIGKALGHQPGSAATHVYTRTHIDPLRDLFDRTNIRLLRDLGYVDPDKVKDIADGKVGR